MRHVLLIAAVAALSFTGLSCAASASAQTTAARPAAEAKQDALKLQLANRFITLMQGDQMGEAMGQMMAAMTPASLADASTAEIAEYRSLMTEISTRMMPRIFEVMAPIYADIFTVEELQALVAFYESDLGRSMMTKSYAAAPRIAEAMQSAMPAIMSDMASVICDRFECSAEELRALKSEVRAQSGG